MKRALGLLLAVAVLSGCAARSTGTAAAPPSTDPAVSPSAAVPAPSGSTAAARPGGSVITLPSGVPKTTAPHEPTDDFAVLSATGQVRVDGACVQLVTDKIVWVLIGPAAAGLHAGQRVKVTGLPDPALESQCSGSPLRVNTVTPAE